MAIELLCFDLDDTLWPCLPTIMHAERTLYAWMRQHVPVITQRYSITELRELRKQFLHAHPHLQTDLSEARRASLRDLSRRLELVDDWVEPAFEVYYQARQAVTLFDDVPPALDSLQTRFRMASISNGNADIQLTGVAKWFEFHVSAEQVGQAKPHPAMFEALLRQAGVDASQAVMVGDHPEHDIAGASQAGMRTVWVNRQRLDAPQCRPDAEIIDFSYLSDAIRQLEAKA